jgi:alpha-ketoglutarate-dependent taurine dioxygenase
MNTRDECILPLATVAALLPEGLELWRSLPDDAGGIILRTPGEPTNDRVLSFAENIGPVGTSAVGVGRAGRTVHEVTPTHEVLKDERGVAVRSTTTWPIPMHTDGYNAEVPPRVAILQVVRAGRGGATTLCGVDESIAELEASSVRRLSEPIFPYTGGFTPILTRPQGHWMIRFNSYEIEEHLRRQHNSSLVTPEHMSAFSELVDVLAARELLPGHLIHLQAGDVLLLNNARTLHGRLPLEEGDTDRLLHRVWCW